MLLFRLKQVFFTGIAKLSNQMLVPIEEFSKGIKYFEVTKYLILNTYIVFFYLCENTVNIKL